MRILKNQQQKSFKDELDKISAKGGYNVGIKGFGMGINFEFSKTTHTKGSEESTQKETSEFQQDFQEGTFQICIINISAKNSTVYGGVIHTVFV